MFFLNVRASSSKKTKKSIQIEFGLTFEAKIP